MVYAEDAVPGRPFAEPRRAQSTRPAIATSQRSRPRRRRCRHAPGEAADHSGLSTDEQRVIAAWGAAATPERLLEAASGVRFQLGQADKFRDGLIRSGAWEPRSPRPSRTAGCRRTSPRCRTSSRRSRPTPIRSSAPRAVAVHALNRPALHARRLRRRRAARPVQFDRGRRAAAAYNYGVLGSWPLALTAYNHGSAGMRRAKERRHGRFRHHRAPLQEPELRLRVAELLPVVPRRADIDQNPEKYFGAIERAPGPLPRGHDAGLRAALGRRARRRRRAAAARAEPRLRPPVWDGSRLLPRGYRLRLPPETTESPPNCSPSVSARTNSMPARSHRVAPRRARRDARRGREALRSSRRVRSPTLTASSPVRA